MVTSSGTIVHVMAFMWKGFHVVIMTPQAALYPFVCRTDIRLVCQVSERGSRLFAGHEGQRGSRVVGRSVLYCRAVA